LTAEGRSSSALRRASSPIRIAKSDFPNSDMDDESHAPEYAPKFAKLQGGTTEEERSENRSKISLKISDDAR